MKKTTKLLALVCAMLMLGSVLAGCSSTPVPSAPAEATAAPEESAAAEATAAPEESAAAEGTASATPTLDAIRERGQLILGTESTYPPFEFIVIENGQSVGAGFDVMLAQKIADKLGVTLVTSEMAFDSLIPAIQAGTIDIAASMTPTDERKQAVDFSENYYETSNVFLVRKGEEGNFTSAESFDGKTIGAQVGTAQNDLVVNDMTNAQSLLLPKVTGAQDRQHRRDLHGEARRRHLCCGVSGSGHRRLRGGGCCRRRRLPCCQGSGRPDRLHQRDY